MRSLLLTLTILLAMALVRSTNLDASVCQSVKPCYCQLSEYSYIDLRPIANQRLTAKKGPLSTTTYEIQLCSSFTKKKCSNVLGCQVKVLSDYAIGNIFNFNSTSLVELQNGAGGRLSKITLVCGSGTDSSLTFEDENPTLTYNFKLTSPYACVKIDPPTTTAFPANTTATTHSTNETTHTTLPTNATTETTHVTNATTETTHPTNATTETTHPSNVTTETTQPTNATTETTPASNTTTVTTHPTVPTNSTTASTSSTSTPSATTQPSTTAPPTTTHKGGASNITSFNVVFLLITGLIINKVSL